jgi:hypothetical protein
MNTEQSAFRFEFDTHGDGDEQEWLWRCVDGQTGSVLKLSRAPFKTLYACIKDAELHGYVSPVARRA